MSVCRDRFDYIRSSILLPLLQRWLPFAVIAVVAIWLRTRELSRRPMHADEANQAVKAGELLEHGRYAFDPRDHHGPTLYYAALPVAWLRSERTLAALTETTVRLVPALAGTAAVLLLGALAFPAGRWVAIPAAAFMAVSPPAVYYSRYFIQETLLVAFTLGTLVCVQRWWLGGRGGWALGSGICAGLMFATKSNAALLALAAAMGVIAVRPAPAENVNIRRGTLAALLAALVTFVLLQTSLGAHPGGLRDALLAFGHGWTRVSGESGHEKPWWYYLRLFTGQRDGGLLWEQRVFFALALGGVGVAAFCRSLLAGDGRAASPASRLLQGTAFYTVLIVAVFSVIPYKTPWHVVHFVPGLALLAAGALVAVARLRTGWLVAVAAAFLGLGSLFQQAWRTAFVRPADARNPYAYVHSSPDVLKFRPLAEAALARSPDQPVRIIGEEYWPLPWYLRGLPQVGYWSAPPGDCDGSLVVVSAAQAETVKSRLRGSYGESVLGLRPGLIFVVFARE